MSKSRRDPQFTKRFERALVRAGAAVRTTARRYGTPIYVWENEKVVAKRP
jgi:hypothetical protein